MLSFRARSSVLVVGLSLTLASSAQAAETKLLGWHPSGAFAYRVDNGKLQVCREDTSDVPSGWPEGVSIGPGAACGDMPEKVGDKPALDAVKQELKGTKSEKKSPFGLDVKVEEKDGKAAVVVSDGPDKKKTLLDVDAGTKVTDVQWRGDGRAVGAVVQGKSGSTVLLANVADLLVGGPAGRKLAEKLHGEGQKLYKKRDWSGAGRLFEEAINADTEWAPARYARAAAEAQGGVGRTAMIENLQWLKTRAEKDATAKKLLGQAKSDSAFDAWVGEPEVRELIGLPAVSSMDVPSRLAERGGTWTLQGATCKAPWVTLKIGKVGKNAAPVSVVVAESCKGKKTQKTGAATLALSSTGGWELQLKKALDVQVAGAAFPAASTIVLDETYQQLKLQPKDGAAAVGTFEPGAARIDDSTL